MKTFKIIARKRKFAFLLCLIWMLFCPLPGKCQNNLVRNPSFEELQNGCPAGISVIKDLTNTPDPSRDRVTHHCKYWRSVTDGTADYYNKCNTTPCIPGAVGTQNFNVIHASEVPGNYMGRQDPYDMGPEDTKQAYAGFGVLAGYAMDLEYIEGEFTEPLIKGMVYEVEYYVSLAEISNHALKNLGFAIVKDQFEQKNSSYTSHYIDYPFNLKNVPDYQSPVRNGNLFDNQTNWMRVYGTFTATGGEDHIIIGYFGQHWDEDSTTMRMQNMNADASPVPITGTCSGLNYSDRYIYYYVDGVSVKATGEVMCNCGATKARVERVNMGDPGMCCWNLYIKNIGDCHLMGEGIFAQYSCKNSGTNFRYIDFMESGQWKGTLWPLTNPDYMKTGVLFENLSDNLLSPDEEIFLGTVCTEPGVPGSTCDLTVGKIRVKDAGGMDFCPSLDPPAPIDCNTPPEECCNNLHAEASFESDSLCPGELTIKVRAWQTSPTPDCAIFGIRLVQGANTGKDNFVNVTILDQFFWPKTNPIFLLASPQGVIAGHFCIPAGKSTRIFIQFLGLDGKIICSKPISVGFGKRSTSIEADDQSSINGINVYPNPASGLINVNVLTDLKQGKITITDAAGKTVLSGAVIQGKNTIDISGLASGSYFIKVTEGTEILAEKLLIKQ